MAEVGGHTNKHVFHDVNYVPYTAYPMAGILLKVIMFSVVKCSLIYDNQHSLHPKKYKKQKLRNKMEPKMESN